MSIEGWQPLACECGARDFVQTYELQWHEGQGTTHKPQGWQCCACSRRAKMEEIVSNAKAKLLEKKIEELKARHASL